MAVDPLDIVTVAEARAFLQFDDDDTDEDDLLQKMITGITPVVEREVGPVVARAVTDLIYGAAWGCPVALPQWPVVSLTSGALLSDDSVVDVSRMVFDKGLLFTEDSSAMPTRTWRLTYRVGRSIVPQNIKMGTLEILDLAWMTQREEPTPAFLIPFRAAAWLKPVTQALGFA